MTTLKIQHVARTVVAGLLTLLLVGCHDDAPVQKRVLVLYDVTSSISAAERANWRAELMDLIRQFGEALWETDEHDEIVVLPIHWKTETATSVFRQRFSGGEFSRNARAHQRAEFGNNLAALDSVQFEGAVLRWTDLLGGISRTTDYMRRSDGTDKHLYIFSDMVQSMPPPGLDFEGSGVPADVETAQSMARQVVSDRKWDDRTLAGIAVHVQLPGTVNGASGSADAVRLAAIDAFWQTILTELGAEIVEWTRL